MLDAALATVQVVPEEEGVGRGDDLRGSTYGELTVLHAVEKREQSSAWLCLCTCGRYATRTTGQLKYSVTLGSKPCCVVCRDELYHGLILDKRAQRVEQHIRLFLDSGTLWHPAVLERLRVEIRDDMRLLLGDWDPPKAEKTLKVDTEVGLEEMDEAAGEDEEWSEELGTAAPWWDEGFRKQPKSTLQLGWSNETAEEKEARLQLADERAAAEEARAAARKLAVNEARRNKRRLEKQAAEDEMNILKSKARDAIAESIAKTGIRPAKIRVLKLHAEPKAPACFGKLFLATEKDCQSCLIAPACKTNHDRQPVPPCFGYFARDAHECVGGNGRPACDLMGRCSNAKNRHITAMENK